MYQSSQARSNHYLLGFPKGAGRPNPSRLLRRRRLFFIAPRRPAAGSRDRISVNPPPSRTTYALDQVGS